MNSAIVVLMEEKQRLERAAKIFSKEIDKLPKGSIQAKKRNINIFYYLVFRDEKKKHRSVYLGKENSQTVKKTRKDIEKRKEFEQKYKQIKKDLTQITKMLPKNER
jgi:hypothetical protein